MTTEFYSTYFNKTVDVPNSKVCGYKMSNSATKKGWSSGLRAGKDNGIAPQKFSRFSTDWEAENKHKCEGNRNWLNKDQRISFTRTRQGQPFSIQRPAFKSGTVVEPDIPVPNLKGNERDGMGNKRIVRNNFISPAFRGREVLNFERLQATDIEQAGIKVQLGDKTLEKLFKIQVPDPTDRKWLEEKMRRIAAGETIEQLEQNPPFGRPQRTINKMVNFAAQGLSIDDKIESIKAAVEQGNAVNRNEMAQVIAQIALILGNVDNLRNITQAGIDNLRQVIERTSIPRDWRAMGFTHRLFSIDQYKQEAGLVNLFLLSNLSFVPNDRTFEYPLVRYDEQGNIIGRTGIAWTVTDMASVRDIRVQGRRQPGFRSNIITEPSKYLDLETRAIIPFNTAVNLVNGGVDNGQLNGQNPPADPPNNGAWLPNVVPRWDYPRNSVPRGIITQGLAQSAPLVPP